MVCSSKWRTKRLAHNYPLLPITTHNYPSLPIITYNYLISTHRAPNLSSHCPIFPSSRNKNIKAISNSFCRVEPPESFESSHRPIISKFHCLTLHCYPLLPTATHPLPSTASTPPPLHRGTSGRSRQFTKCLLLRRWAASSPLFGTPLCKAATRKLHVVA